MYPIRPNHILKIRWKIHFFTFLNTDRNAPKKKFRIVIIQHFIRKLLSKLILDLRKCPNQKTHESESAGFLVLTKTLQKCFRTVIIQHFIRKLLLKLISGHGKGPHQKTCTFTFMRFLVRALPKVRDQIRKQFFNKVLYNYCSKKKMERFVPKNCVKKMDFPLYFQKVILPAQGLFFYNNFF